VLIVVSDGGDNASDATLDAVLVEARFHQTAPIAQPPLIVTQTVLAGDSGDAKAASVPVPAAGTMLGRLEAPSVKLSTTVLEGYFAAAGTSQP
jgi:hypothetical protein